MNMKDTNTRKGVRSVVQAILLLGFLGLIWWVTDRLLPGDLPSVVKWLIAVIAIAVTGNQIENGVRSFKIGKDGIEAEGDGSAGQ